MTFRQFMKRYAFMGFAMAGLALIGAIILGPFGHDRSVAGTRQHDVVSALPVATERLESISSIEQLRTYTGTVKARRTSDLSFDRTARLIAVMVDEGDEVQAGQTLAVLNTSNLETKRQELEAQRDAAQALLDELIKGPREETIAAARADVRALAAQVQLLETEHQRNQRLSTSNAISEKDLDRTRFTKQTSQARLDAAQRRLDELEAGTRKEKIRAQQAVVAQVDAALADLAIQLQDSNLVAPFDGSIGKRYVDEGTIVSPGNQVLRLVEREGIEVWIGLPTTTVAHVKDDRHYTVVIDGRSFTAALHSVLPELDLATRTRTAIFTLKDAELGTVVPGQIARIRIAAQLQVAGFWVPTTALTHGSRGLWSVYAVEPDSAGRHEVAVRRDVEVLYTQGDRALIRGTVSQGDRVIATGSYRVALGQPVRCLGQDATTIAATTRQAPRDTPLGRPAKVRLHDGIGSN